MSVSNLSIGYYLLIVDSCWFGRKFESGGCKVSVKAEFAVHCSGNGNFMMLFFFMADLDNYIKHVLTIFCCWNGNPSDQPVHFITNNMKNN